MKLKFEPVCFFNLYCICIIVQGLFITSLLRELLIFQERSLALSEERPLPALCSSADIRPLKMEDFKYAHEQVY